MTNRILMMFLIALVGLARQTRGMVLADGGRTDLVIVAADDAPPLEKMAAEELRRYLKQITTAEFPIRKEAEGGAIHVGPTEAVKRLAPDVDWAALDPDGIVIRTVGDKLVLAGGHHRGTLHAVYTFLQDTVGCRFWAPDSELVPKKPTLKIEDLDVVYRPPFDMRVISSEPFMNKTFAHKSRMSVELEMPFGDHTIHRLLPPDEHFLEHPEWYMYAPNDEFQNNPDGDYTFAKRLGQLKNAKPRQYELAKQTRRLPNNPCLSHPEARRAIGDAVLAALANGSPFNTKYSDWKHPPKILWVTQWDGRYMCQCDKCTEVREAEGSQSALWVTAANEIAQRVEQDHPDVLVGTFAYLQTKQPPKTVRPRDNVLIYMAFLDRDHGTPIPQIPELRNVVQGWCAIAKHVYAWDYNANFRNYVKPHPNYFVQPKSIRFYHDAGVTGVFVESVMGNAGDFVRMRYYVNSQLMWDPTQDPQTLTDEFMRGYYGAAAPYLLDHLRNLRRVAEPHFISCYFTSTEPWLTLDALNTSTRLFDEAQEAVADDPTLTRRVRRARLGLEMVWLDRFHELMAESKRMGKPFLGPEDPYARIEQIGGDEIYAGTYKRWKDLPHWVAAMRLVFPPRTGRAPDECRKLKAYEWEDLQETKFEGLLDRRFLDVVEDPKASDGRAARLLYDGSAKQADTVELKVPISRRLAGRWHVRVVARNRARGTRGGDASAVTMGIDMRDGPDGAVKRTARVVAHFPPVVDSDYMTFDLGSHDLPHGSTIWVRPRGHGAYGDSDGVWVDRIFLTAR
jgi:hypothetical protein